jgi:hypothetical protein
MLVITSDLIDPEDAEQTECKAIDYATVHAAEARGHEIFLDDIKCPFPVMRVVSIKPMDDIIVPIPVCMVHFNAFVVSVNSGVVSITEDFGQ